MTRAIQVPFTMTAGVFTSQSCVRALVAVVVMLFTAIAQAADTVGDCRIGSYRLSDGSLIDIGPSTGDALRWRRFDGTTGALHRGPNDVWSSTLGWTNRADGKSVRFSACDVGRILFGNIAGQRIAFDVTETKFSSGSIKLAGRLVLPKTRDPVPVVVLLHGSENYSGRDFYALQRLLPGEDVGVFVYDKRGTGRSEGKYTQDFSVLADDAVAAVAEARRLAGNRAARLGFQGGSQGGYIAPLAASRVAVDFVISSFGLVVTPLEEDREEIVLEMTIKHHSPTEIEAALEVADAAGKVLTSGLTAGFEQFDAVRSKYRDAPWYKDLHGNFTYTMLPYSKQELRARSEEFLVGTPMNYDGMAVLRKLETPQLWILAKEDLDAPSKETSRRLKGLQNQGRPIAVAMFPDTQHGIYNFESSGDGSRVNTRNAAGYFAMMRDFARGELRGPYGDSTLTEPRVRHVRSADTSERLPHL
jgi:uncharacterized protein